jgi:hypothetical protein
VERRGKVLLADSREMYQQKLQNAGVLGSAIEETLRLLGKE